MFLWFRALWWWDLGEMSLSFIHMQIFIVKDLLFALLCFWAIEKELLPIKKMHADGCKFNKSL